jgi:hypothetical protein
MMGIKHVHQTGIANHPAHDVSAEAWNQDHTIDGPVDFNGHAIINATGLGSANLDWLVNVKDYGALGDGSTDDTAALQAAINAALVRTDPNAGDEAAGNKILFFPGGIYVTSDTLTIINAFGGMVLGAGSYASTIRCTAGDRSVIFADGCRNCTFREFGIFQPNSATDGACFDLTKTDNSTRSATTANSFRDMLFSGLQGLRIGQFANQNCSETFIENCTFNGNGSSSLYGVKNCHANALNNWVVGGGFSGWQRGIYSASGSSPNIVGGSFAGNGWDIWQHDGNTIHISGVRTESSKFCTIERGNATISACQQNAGLGDSSAVFFAAAGSEVSTIESCLSFGGSITMNSGGMVSSCEIGRDDWAIGNFSFENIWAGQTAGGIGSGTQKFLRAGRVLSGVAYPKEQLFAVASLPSAASFGGERYMVSDANATTFNSIVAGGGANKVPVYSDGTNWRIG